MWTGRDSLKANEPSFRESMLTAYKQYENKTIDEEELKNKVERWVLAAPSVEVAHFVISTGMDEGYTKLVSVIHQVAALHVG
jgi:hypothetical protein